MVGGRCHCGRWSVVGVTVVGGFCTTPTTNGSISLTEFSTSLASTSGRSKSSASTFNSIILFFSS